MEIHIFSQDDKLLATLSESVGLLNTNFREELNRGSTFTFTIEDSAYHGHPPNHVKEENQVMFRDKDGEYRLYTIKELESSNDDNGPETFALCEPSFMELAEFVIEERFFTNVEAGVALSGVLEGTRWTPEIKASLGTGTTHFYYDYVVDAIWEILRTYTGEFKDVIDFDEVNNEIRAKIIRLLPRRGQDLGKRFEIGHDIERIERTVLSYPVTALYGRGSSLDIVDEEGNSTGGNTRFIDFSEVEWKVSKGDPVDKPLGQKWVSDPDALEKYGYLENGKLLNRSQIWQDNDIEDVEVLLRATWNQLQLVKGPEVNYKLSVFLLEQLLGYEHEKVSLGDTGFAVDREFSRPIEIQSRIIVMEYDVLDIENTSVVEMGQFISAYDDDPVRDLAQLIDSNRGKWETAGDITEGSFPDIIPKVPSEFTATGGFQVIQLAWEYVSALHIANYEVYGSQVKDFVPQPQHMIWRGLSSGTNHKVDSDEVWYYRVRSVNHLGKPGGFSPQVQAEAIRVISDDILFGSITADKLASDLDLAGKLDQGTLDWVNEFPLEKIEYTQEQIDATKKELIDGFELVDGELIKVNTNVDELIGFKDSTIIKLSNIDETLINQGTNINQNTEAIKLGATKKEHDALAGSVTEQMAAVNIKADEVLTTVKNIQIGGRNKIPNSAIPRTLPPIENQNNYLIIHTGLKRNTTYTFSSLVEVLAGSTDVITVYPYLSSGNNMPTNLVPIIDGRITVTFKTDGRFDYNLLLYAGQHGTTSGKSVKFSEYQLEEGTKRSDWRIAPEDDDERMTKSEASIKVLSDQVILKVDRNGIIGEINLSPEKIRLQSKLIHLSGQSLIDNAVIGSAAIANLSVTAAKIALLAVGTAQIGNAVITNAKIGNLAVDAAKIASAAITEAKIANAAITNAKIANASITSAKIDSIDASKIKTGILEAIDIVGVNISGSNIIGAYIKSEVADDKGSRSVELDKSKITSERIYIDAGWTEREIVTIERGQIWLNDESAQGSGAFKVNYRSYISPAFMSFQQGAVETIINAKEIKTPEIRLARGVIFGDTAKGGTLETGRLIISADDRSGLLKSTDSYGRTYSGSANGTITSNGVFGRITSAARYKLCIKNVETINYAENILKLNPRSWVDKAGAESFADYLTENDGCAEGLNESGVDIPYLDRHYGLIAEEVEQAGLKEYVSYGDRNEEGIRETEGIEYDRLWTLLIPVVRDLKKYAEEEINRLNIEIQSLKGGN